MASLTASARRDGEAYVLNGEKMWISLASRADHFLWFARTNPEASDPHDGLSAFLLESDRPGVTRGDIHGKLGIRAGSTGWVSCQDVRVPARLRIGEEGEGFKIAMACLDGGRYTVAAGATGLIRACLEASLRYARQRQAFGHPVAGFQLIQRKIAGMVQSYEMARLLYLRAGWMQNEGRRCTREISFAKKFATEASFRPADDAIQIHGAYGFSDEFDVERYLRNARGAIIYEGSSEIQTIIQAESALGKRNDKALRLEQPAYNAEEWQA